PGLAGTSDATLVIMTTLATLVAPLLAYVAMLPGIVRSNLPRAEVALALVAVASVFLSGRLSSDARYLAIAWPFAWFMAGRREPWRGAWFLLSASMYAILGLLATMQVLVP